MTKPQKCRAPSPPKQAQQNSQILINNNEKDRKAPKNAQSLPKFEIDRLTENSKLNHIKLSDELKPNHQPHNEEQFTNNQNNLEEDSSINQQNDTNHVSIISIKDDKDVSIVKTSSSTPKIKNENKTIFQVENEQNMSFLSNRNQSNKHHSDHHQSDNNYNHRQQTTSISPPLPPTLSTTIQQQKFLISTKQTVLVSEQPYEKETEQRSRSRSRPSSYHEALHESKSDRKTNHSSSHKVDKLQQINDKLSSSETSTPKQNRITSSSSKLNTKTDQANLDFVYRNVRREPSNAGSLSSVDSNQQSVTRNSKIIEKGMAMVQLRKNKVGDKVSIIG